jgi:hypothetical protein
MNSCLVILGLTYLSLIAALPELLYSTIDGEYDRDDIIWRDVVIVGGGSGGTYTASRLRELGHSVVVIEKTNTLGGHTNTYTVPDTGLKIDYGVVVFHNTSVVRNYFEHYKVPLSSVEFAAPNSISSVDFRTGKIVPGFTAPDPTTALETWVNQLKKYPFLVTGLHLPDPVPADLIIPFKDFVKKHNLDAMVQTINRLGQGYANLLDQPTLYAMKLLSLELVATLETGFVATAAHDNHALYDAISTE